MTKNISLIYWRRQGSPSGILEIKQEDFYRDIQCQDAVIRRIEIIGEAARRVSDKTRTELPLPWSDMVSMRNRMIHEYDDIDITTVWVTAKRDLPPLIAFLEKIIKSGDDK